MFPVLFLHLSNSITVVRPRLQLAINTPLHKAYAIDGNETVLECSVKANPSVTEVHWLLDGKPILPNNPIKGIFQLKSVNQNLPPITAAKENSSIKITCFRFTSTLIRLSCSFLCTYTYRLNNKRLTSDLEADAKGTQWRISVCCQKRGRNGQEQPFQSNRLS